MLCMQSIAQSKREAINSPRDRKQTCALPPLPYFQDFGGCCADYELCTNAVIESHVSNVTWHWRSVVSFASLFQIFVEPLQIFQC